MSAAWEKLSSLPVSWSVDDIRQDDESGFNQQQNVRIGDLDVGFRNFNKDNPRICQVYGSAIDESKDHHDQFSFDGILSARMDLGGQFLPDQLRKDGVASVIFESKGSQVFVDSEKTPGSNVSYISRNGRIEVIEFISMQDANREGVITYKLANGKWEKTLPKKDFGLTTSVFGTNDHGYTSIQVGDSEIIPMPPIDEKLVLEKGTKLVDEIVAGYTELTSMNKEGGYGGKNAQALTESGQYPNLSSRVSAAADLPIGPADEIENQSGRYSLSDPRRASDQMGPTEE